MMSQKGTSILAMELNLSWLRRVLILCLLLYHGATACSPGSSSRTGKEPRITTPLKYKQRVPNISEDTLGASGPSEGNIMRNTALFDDLSPNNNADILFKDEEGTGADRMMSKRCKDKLNALAISVLNRWPGVKLRVIEAWDEDGHHSTDSLHYEGRAVDITTSDKDKEKYGMLARMAVDAGFDWVYFENRNWIHVSVKSDESEAARSGGCFPADSTVALETGETRTLDELRIGDRVKAIDSQGEIVYSDVMMFLDRKLTQNTLFYVIETEDPDFRVTLTPQHLLYVSEHAQTNFSESRAVFASHVKTGQFLYTTVQDHDRQNGGGGDAQLRALRISRTTLVTKRGAVAPLTRHGTVIVDDVVVSAYAVIQYEWIAHTAFLPVRIYHDLKQYMWGESPPERAPDNVSWYPKALYKIGEVVLKDYMHPQSLDL